MRVLAIALAAEFIVFDRLVSRNFAWVFPRWNDQVQYLTESYTGWEAIRRDGIFPGLWQTLVNPAAQGAIHDFAAQFVFMIAGGPSRSAALALNMLALIAWQVALFFSVRRTFRSTTLALLAALLPVALARPWESTQGAATDFRLDHIAMCVFGIAAALALPTDRFRSRNGSIVFGAAVGFAILARFITGTYFALAYVVLASWVLAGKDRLAGLRNLVVSGLVATVVAGPLLWLNRKLIWEYYYFGHITGPERALRDSHLDLADSLGFIASHVFREQLGLLFGIFAVGAGVALFLVRKRRAPDPGNGSACDAAVIGLAFALGPTAMLAYHNQKSALVLGVIVPGLVLATIAAWRRLAANAWLPTSVLILLAALAPVRVGLALNAQRPTPEFEADARKVNSIADLLFKSSESAKLASPRIAVDQVTDSLDAQIMRVIFYERHGKWIPALMMLPTGIFADDEKLIMQRLSESDFVFLTEDGPVGQWPYDRQLRDLLPSTMAWCDANLELVQRLPLFGKTIRLYERRRSTTTP